MREMGLARTRSRRCGAVRQGVEGALRAGGCGNRCVIEGSQFLRGRRVELERNVPEIGAIVREVGAGDQHSVGAHQPAQGVRGGRPLLAREAADVERNESGMRHEKSAGRADLDEWLPQAAGSGTEWKGVEVRVNRPFRGRCGWRQAGFRCDRPPERRCPESGGGGKIPDHVGAKATGLVVAV